MNLADLKTKTHAWLSARVWHLTAAGAVLFLLLLLMAAWMVSSYLAKPEPQPAPLSQTCEDLQTEEPAAAPEPAPGPAPARPAAPRAAVRPQSPPAAPAPTTSWGTTDLDREIAAFPRPINQEPAK